MEQQEGIKEWYRPSDKIKEFHASRHFVRFLIGGRGSAKTTSSSQDAFGHCHHIAGARVIVARKTKESNMSTSIQTFNETYEKNGLEESGDETSLFRKWDGGTKVRIPSAIAMEKFEDFMKHGPRKSEIQHWLKTVGTRFCSFIEFIGLKDEKISENALRGMECTMLILIEADMLTRGDFDMALQCLRAKDAYDQHVKDRNCIVETNPPGPTHWIAELEKEKRKESKHHNFEFWHLRTVENQHNLDPGDLTTIPPRLSYLDSLKQSYEGNPSMYARMVEGEYSEAHPGNPVFYRFRLNIHKAADIPWPTRAYLIRTWDFGVFNAVCWAALFEKTFIGDKGPYSFNYLRFVAEQYLEGSDVERQCEEAIKLTEAMFPFWNDRDICSGIKDYADPTGKSITGMGIEKNKRSYFQVLQSHGIAPGYRYIDNQPSIALVNRALGEFDPDGNPMIQIDEECCPLIIAGCSGKYRYPAPGEAGYGLDNAAPLKGSVTDNIDHICLTGDTLIAIEIGFIELQYVIPGMRVWTRKGLRQVEAWALTQKNAEVCEYEFTNGRKLKATGDHPVWVKNIGWKRIDKLMPSDILIEWSNQLNSTESLIADTQTAKIKTLLIITALETVRGIFTAQSTNIITALFRRVIMFITKTVIRSTMLSRIWSVSRLRSMSEDGIIKDRLQKAQPSSKESGHLQQNGTGAKRAAHGIASTESTSWRIESSLIYAANNAELSSSPKTQTLDSARTNVRAHGDVTQDSTTLISSAHFAKRYLTKTNISSLGKSSVHIARKKPIGRHDVYNITIAGGHEYFANGILVSNCDVFRYTIHNTMKMLRIDDAKSKPPVGKLKQTFRSFSISKNDMYGKRPKANPSRV